MIGQKKKEREKRSNRIASEEQKSQASGKSASAYGTSALPIDAELFEQYVTRPRPTASQTTPMRSSTQSEESVGEKSKVSFCEAPRL